MQSVPPFARSRAIFYSRGCQGGIGLPLALLKYARPQVRSSLYEGSPLVRTSLTSALWLPGVCLRGTRLEKHSGLNLVRRGTPSFREDVRSSPQPSQFFNCVSSSVISSQLYFHPFCRRYLTIPLLVSIFYHFLKKLKL